MYGMRIELLMSERLILEKIEHWSTLCEVMNNNIYRRVIG